jgi:hypothetical protein
MRCTELTLMPPRFEYPALKRAVRDQQSLFNASEVLIEDKASGSARAQTRAFRVCFGRRDGTPP